MGYKALGKPCNTLAETYNKKATDKQEKINEMGWAHIRPYSERFSLHKKQKWRPKIPWIVADAKSGFCRYRVNHVHETAGIQMQA